MKEFNNLITYERIVKMRQKRTKNTLTPGNVDMNAKKYLKNKKTGQ